MDYQEEGLVSTIEGAEKESNAILVKEGVGSKLTDTGILGCEKGARVTDQAEIPKFSFEPVNEMQEGGSFVGSGLSRDEEGPRAMTYDMESGWVAEVLGPTSGHWKRRAREGKAKGKRKGPKPSGEKKKH